MAATPLSPMLATLAEGPLAAKGWVYEPKYDGIRAIAELGRTGTVRLWSRLGNEKTAQFPEVAAALARAAGRLRRSLVLDGEIVALDADGRPIGFQGLQGRIHLSGARDIERATSAHPTAFIAFDVLRDEDEDLRPLPLSERRKRLERRLRSVTGPVLRVSEQVADDGAPMQARAIEGGWEGIVAKDSRAPYHSGRRSPAWLKLKLLKRQEFVIGGWTEPRQTRSHFGALLLGLYDAEGRLEYVGHTGTGFDQKELARVYALLQAREAPQSPFASRIKTNEPAHWVRPDLVAEVRFTEWTSDRKLRHPVYLGLRDDKLARTVVREEPTGGKGSKGSKGSKEPTGAKASTGSKGSKRSRSAVARASQAGASEPEASAPQRSAPTRSNPSKRSNPSNRSNPSDRSTLSNFSSLSDSLLHLESSRKDGFVELPGGDRLKVTNLHKIFWPKQKITKGELLRYYLAVSPFILPAVQDRPLVMKRFPNGIEGMAFYQQRSREEKPPAGVRIETLPDDIDPIGEPDARRLIGGSLTTLLYMTQIAAISQDPWFSRVQSPLHADYVAIDLDPTDTATFARVLDVARWVRDELEALGVPGYPKTSGASGLHVYIPLAPGTTYESGLLLCQIVATIVATRHPKAATVERTVRARPAGTVYVDYLQNIVGKTLATAYSARASEFAGVSTPLDWSEVDAGVDPQDFTVRTVLARFRERGDLWSGLRTGRPADLRRVLQRVKFRG